MKSFKDKIKEKTKTIKEKFILGSLGSNPLSDIVDVLKDIANFFVLAYKGLEWTIKFLIWLLKFGLYLILELLNPIVLIRDLVENSFKIPKQLIYAFQNLIHNLSKSVTNTLLEPLFNNIFGWDSTKKDEGKDCYETKPDEISVTLILSTILLPPLGAFMKFGLRSWEDILISGILTMIFYFPGLIFALVKIFT